MFLSTYDILTRYVFKPERYYSDEHGKTYRCAYFHRDLDAILEHDIAYRIGTQVNLEPGEKNVWVLTKDQTIIQAKAITKHYKVKNSEGKINCYMSFIVLEKDVKESWRDLQTSVDNQTGIIRN